MVALTEKRGKRRNSGGNLLGERPSKRFLSTPEGTAQENWGGKRGDFVEGRNEGDVTNVLPALRRGLEKENNSKSEVPLGRVSEMGEKTKKRKSLKT